MSLQIEDKYTQNIPQKKAVLKTDSAPDTIKIAPHKTESSVDTLKITNGKKIPQEVDKQLDIVYKTGLANLDNMPTWLKFLGGSKVKKEFISLVESKKFQQEMDTIMTQAREKSTKANKDVIELLKEPEVIDKVFSCLSNHSQKGSLLHFILSSSIVKEKFSKNIKENKHRYLLYGKE